MAEGKFVTVINCMDGRTQLPMIEWMKEEFDADFVDSITEPGPNGILAGEKEPLCSSIRDRVSISVNGHGSGIVALVGHHDCAGNPGPKDMQVDQVLKGLEIIRKWGFSVSLIGVWIGEDWKVKLISGPHE